MIFIGNKKGGTCRRIPWLELIAMTRPVMFESRNKCFRPIMGLTYSYVCSFLISFYACA